METASNGSKPPYGGFGTYWNFIAQLSEHGDDLPGRLDRSVMGSRGGSTRAELYGALRFFEQMTEDKAPTPALQELTRDPSKPRLRALVEKHYAPVIALNLASATPGMVDAKLAEMGATPSTVRRARAFFINAAEVAGIPVGKLLKARAAAGTVQRKRSSKPKQTKPAAEESQQNGAASPKDGLPDLVAAMLRRFPTKAEGWDEASFSRFMNLLISNATYEYGLDPEKVKVGS